MKLLRGPFTLHDVRDVEAHVRRILDRRLGELGARLNADEYEDALAYLLAICWELAGVDDRGRPRRVFYAKVFLDVEEIEDGDSVERVGPFPSRERAAAAGDRLIERERIEGDHAIIELEEASPPGAYDPTIGLAFSTYSFRILRLRVTDWYRDRFGDSRYGEAPERLSLEALADDLERPIAELADRSHDTDEEEVLTRVALGR